MSSQLRLSESGDVHRDGVCLYSFSLIEKLSGAVAAMTFGFGSGVVFEDYTMCTLAKDSRSCGSILNKLVGSILQQAGFSLWYWGYEMAYMRDYASYGAVHLTRSDFYNIWRQSGPFKHISFSDARLPCGVKILIDPLLV